MKKFITKEEVEKAIPTEPRFLRFKLGLSVFIMATILGYVCH